MALQCLRILYTFVLRTENCTVFLEKTVSFLDALQCCGNEFSHFNFFQNSVHNAIGLLSNVSPRSCSLIFLGLFQTLNFSCAESNANEQSPLF